MKWITLQDIEKSLPVTPIAVGFDVDDTVLFSSPGVFYGVDKLGPKAFRDSKFYEAWNRDYDHYSLPKYSARLLIEMHQRRGDQIYFITARPPTKGEQVTRLLQKHLKIEKMNPVVFNDFHITKTQNIQSRKIAVYYGDADTDITESRAAGARPIRVLRAINSLDHRPVQYGAYGEEVLVESDR